MTATTTALQYWFDHFASAEWMTIQDMLDSARRAGDYCGDEVRAEMCAAAKHFAAGLPRPA
jgi:hypothetical protein